MREIVAAIFGVAAMLIVSSLTHREAYRRGFESGRSVGQAEGRKAVEDWCAEMGRHVDSARQQIWREEGTKQ